MLQKTPQQLHISKTMKNRNLKGRIEIKNSEPISSFGVWKDNITSHRFPSSHDGHTISATSVRRFAMEGAKIKSVAKAAEEKPGMV